MQQSFPFSRFRSLPLKDVRGHWEKKEQKSRSGGRGGGRGEGGGGEKKEVRKDSSRPLPPVSTFV